MLIIPVTFDIAKYLLHKKFLRCIQLVFSNLCLHLETFVRLFQKSLTAEGSSSYQEGKTEYILLWFFFFSSNTSRQNQYQGTLLVQRSIFPCNPSGWLSSYSCFLTPVFFPVHLSCRINFKWSISLVATYSYCTCPNRDPVLSPKILNQIKSNISNCMPKAAWSIWLFSCGQDIKLIYPIKVKLSLASF